MIIHKVCGSSDIQAAIRVTHYHKVIQKEDGTPDAGDLIEFIVMDDNDDEDGEYETDEVHFFWCVTCNRKAKAKDVFDPGANVVALDG